MLIGVRVEPQSWKKPGKLTVMQDISGCQCFHGPECSCKRSQGKVKPARKRHVNFVGLAPAPVGFGRPVCCPSALECLVNNELSVGDRVSACAAKSSGGANARSVMSGVTREGFQKAA